MDRFLYMPLLFSSTTYLLRACARLSHISLIFHTNYLLLLLILLPSVRNITDIFDMDLFVLLVAHSRLAPNYTNMYLLFIFPKTKCNNRTRRRPAIHKWLCFLAVGFVDLCLLITYQMARFIWLFCGTVFAINEPTGFSLISFHLFGSVGNERTCIPHTCRSHKYTKTQFTLRRLDWNIS